MGGYYLESNEAKTVLTILMGYNNKGQNLHFQCVIHVNLKFHSSSILENEIRILFEAPTHDEKSALLSTELPITNHDVIDPCCLGVNTYM